MKKQNKKTRNKQKTFISILEKSKQGFTLHPFTPLFFCALRSQNKGSPFTPSHLCSSVSFENSERPPLPQCRQKIEKKNEGLGE
jgi:hypothetical protein